MAAIGVLDAELEATMVRLQRIRAELALILKHRAPIDTPSPFEAVAAGLSPEYRGLLTVYSRVFEDSALDDVTALLSEPDDASVSFESLGEDSDDEAVEQAAGLLAVSMASHQARFPWMAKARSGTRSRGNLAQEVLVPAVAEVFNRGQLRALARAAELVKQRSAREDTD